MGRVGMWLIAGLLAAVLIGCGGGEGGNTTPPPGGGGELLTGPSTQVASTLVSASGGTFTVSQPGNAANGVSVSVPAGAYSSARTFTVSAATVYGSTFGTLFHAISPLLVISNGGGYASRLMTVRIPVTIPAGQFAMAFAYDPDAGRLEGLPVVSETATTITIAVRHFTGVRAGQSETRLVVTAAPMADLAVAAGSGFRPGRDNLSTPNYGTARFDTGHGAGQTAAALWYYFTRRAAGDDALFTRFRGELATAWEDDVTAQAWASEAQETLTWGTLWADISTVFANTPDSVARYAGAYSLLLTADPQCVVLDGSLGDALALTVYGATTNALKVADPVAPGDAARVLEWQATAFAPYKSANKVGAALRDFTAPRYLGLSAVLPWAALGELWPDVADGSISTTLPTVDLRRILDDGTNIRLSQSSIYHDDHVKLGAQVDNRNVYVTVFSADGTELASGTVATVPLALGNNRLGLCIHRGSTVNDRWEGFQWVMLKRE